MTPAWTLHVLGIEMRETFSFFGVCFLSHICPLWVLDLDECATDEGNCQHECVNTLGSYICTCHNGYTLHENGRDCIEGGCKYEISSPSGTLTSPNYPDYYPGKKVSAFENNE